ncbi:MAG TPA: hypothetical protein VGW38_10365 [Chloroflexota bacterium]|nr:hypothetical protein [Chloroflexota bacterium]
MASLVVRDAHVMGGTPRRWWHIETILVVRFSFNPNDRTHRKPTGTDGAQ